MEAFCGQSELYANRGCHSPFSPVAQGPSNQGPLLSVPSGGGGQSLRSRISDVHREVLRINFIESRTDTNTQLVLY